MYVIVKNKNKIKGKTVSEYAKNLESEGFPSEYSHPEMKERIRYIEKDHRFRREDLEQIKRQVGYDRSKEIEKIARDLGCKKR